MPDFLDETRREIAARLKQLEPALAEYSRLRAAATALDGVCSSTGPTSRARAGHATGVTATPRPRRSPDTDHSGRPRGSGTRAKQALMLVGHNPGITIPEMAERMGINQNYLYRVLPGLADDGLVRKEGRGWHPTVVT